MLVEDPRDTIKALCDLPDCFSRQSFKDKYEWIKGLAKPISSQHTDTHFYSLSIFGIIEPLESGAKGLYKLSVAGKALCQSLRNEDIQNYQKILANVLLNNSNKGKLFRDFVALAKSKTTMTLEDVSKYVKKVKEVKKDSTTIGIVARTLLAWCEDAGLIERDNDREIIWFIASGSKKYISLDEFWSLLCSKYRILTQSEIFGLERIYVDILELRTLICLDLSWSNEDFNNYLSQVLDSEREDKIKLYGAPTSFFSDRENFSYKGRIYAYISIRCA
jgi:hypothetical protein